MMDHPPTPRLTIGIPTRQRLPLLREAVAAALAQTGPPGQVEVLLSQDVFPDRGPDEPLLAWCQDAAAADARVRHLVASRPLGLAGNWNAVVAAARGEFLVIPGDDDRLLPAFAETLLQVADAGGGADVVFSDHFVMDAAGVRDVAGSDARAREFARADLPPGLIEPAEPMVWRNVVPMLSAVVRTDLARRFPFQEDLNTPELEFFVRLAQAGARFAFVPERLAEYRLHGGAATAAGLWSDRLALRLLDLPAGAPEAEAPKAAFLRRILPNAVSRALSHGDSQQARVFLRSPYYPRDAGGLPELARRFCAALPGPVARASRRLFCAVRDLRAAATTAAAGRGGERAR